MLLFVLPIYLILLVLLAFLAICLLQRCLRSGGRLARVVLPAQPAERRIRSTAAFLVMVCVAGAGMLADLWLIRSFGLMPLLALLLIPGTAVLATFIAARFYSAIYPDR